MGKIQDNFIGGLAVHSLLNIAIFYFFKGFEIGYDKALDDVENKKHPKWRGRQNEFRSIKFQEFNNYDEEELSSDYIRRAYEKMSSVFFMKRDKTKPNDYTRAYEQL